VAPFGKVNAESTPLGLLSVNSSEVLLNSESSSVLLVGNSGVGKSESGCGGVDGGVVHG
jgi:predicted GTPase